MHLKTWKKFQRLTLINREQLERKITHFEEATAVELVVSLQQKAESYMEFAFSYAFFFLFLAWGTTDHDWAQYYLPEVFLLLALLSFWMVPFFPRFFVPSYFIKPRVNQRAKAVFFEEGVRGTEARRAVLLVIFRSEKKIELLFDTGLFDKVDQKFIEGCVEVLSQKLKNLSLGEALEEGVEALEEKFKKQGLVYPKKNFNELANDLREKNDD